MYVLREGEVEVSRRSQAGKNTVIVDLGAGETFGEMTLVELQPRSATVIAKKRCITYSLTNMDLYHLYQQDNYAYVIILQNICRMLSRRLRKADGRIVEFLSGGNPGPKPKPPMKSAKTKPDPKAKPEPKAKSKRS
jgi:CRP/FNR family cyclic AMP-dependent transcriptional regulator